MHRKLAVILLLLDTFNNVAADPSTQQTVGLRNVAMLVGDLYNLKCTSNSPFCGSLQWLKRNLTGHEEVITYGRSLVSDFDRRYSMNADNVPCDISIRDVTRTDAGEFTCVSPDYGRQSAFLTVLESRPHCAYNTTEKEVLEGEHVIISCSVTGYRTTSQVDLTWVDTRDQAAVETARQDRGTGSIRSSFVVIARSPAIYPYSCRTRFEPTEKRTGLAQNVPEVTCLTKEIRVVYPVRDIRLKMNGTRFTDGVKVTCLADGQPSPAYRWIVKPSGATITDGAEVTLRSAFTYQCIASNEIRGQVYTETSWEIYVQPAPVKVARVPVMTVQPTLPETSPSTPSSTSVITSPSADDNARQMQQTLEPFATAVLATNKLLLNTTSIVLSVLLLFCVVVILFLLVRLCRTRARLAASQRVNEKQAASSAVGVYSPLPASASSSVTRQLITPTEALSNGSAGTAGTKTNTSGRSNGASESVGATKRDGGPYWNVSRHDQESAVTNGHVASHDVRLISVKRI